MNMPKYIGYTFLLMCFTSCGTKTNIETAGEQTVESVSLNDAKAENTTGKELINRVYDKFVFAIDSEENDSPEDYFTTNALKKTST